MKSKRQPFLLRLCVVAPFAGAWIEIPSWCYHPEQERPSLPSRERGLKLQCLQLLILLPVAPFAGAWIEMRFIATSPTPGKVAPFAGAWIEINDSALNIRPLSSLPSRERGLKYRPAVHSPIRSGRSLRGSVD